MTAIVPLVMTLMIVTAGAMIGPQATTRTEGISGSVGDCLTVPIQALAASPIEGHARLCLDRPGVRPTLWASGIRTGEVYTAWLAYFDDPSSCLNKPCDTFDLLGDDPAGVLARVDGGIGPDAGEIHLQAHIRDLDLARRSQVSVLLLGHGSVSGKTRRMRARQLLTLQTPELGAPLAGAAADGGRAWPLGQAVFIVP